MVSSTLDCSTGNCGTGPARSVSLRSAARAGVSRTREQERHVGPTPHRPSGRRTRGRRRADRAVDASASAPASDEGSEAFTQQSLWREPGVAEAASALELNLSRPDKRIIVALVDGEIVGATVCDVSTLTPINLTRVLIVTEIQVSPRFRRRSVASTLLSAAASYGEDHNCEIVVAAIPVALARAAPLPDQDRLQPDRGAARHPVQQAALAPDDARPPTRATPASSSPCGGRCAAARATPRAIRPRRASHPVGGGD